MRYVIRLNNGNMPDPLYLVMPSSRSHWARADCDLLWTMSGSKATRIPDERTARSVAMRIGLRWPRFRLMTEIRETKS